MEVKGLALFIVMTSRLITGLLLGSDGDPLDAIQIGFETVTIPEDTRSSHGLGCGSLPMNIWQIVPMSDSTALFLVLQSVKRLLEQGPSAVGFSGKCHSISLTYGLLYRKRTLSLSYTGEAFVGNQRVCCLIYSSKAGEKSPDTSSMPSPYEGVDIVLRNTFTKMSWNSTCVLYDTARTRHMQLAVQSLHAAGIKYIVRRVQSDRLFHRTILDCMALQTRHSPSFVGIFTNELFRHVLSQMRELCRDIQGLDAISQWLIWTDNLTNIDLNGIPLLNIAILQNTREYIQGGAQYRLLSNTGNLSENSFQTAVEWNSDFVPRACGDVDPSSPYMLNGITLTVTTKVWPPFTIKETTSDGRVVFSGFCVDMLNELSSRLNFRLVEPADNEWGRLLDGKWTGMMHQLVTKDVDMMVAAISIQQEREEAVDFTYPFFYDYKGIITQVDHTEAAKHWAGLIDPFDTVSLLALILVVPLTAGILCLCENVTPINERERLWTSTDSNRLGVFSNCLLYLYGALLSEGGEDSCRSMTGRTIIAFWWLFAMVMGGIYTGNLVASRTIVKATPVINTLVELLAHPHFRWGIEQGDYLSMMFPTSKIDKYKEIWAGVEEFNKTDPRVLSSNYSVHMAAVKSGNYAFFNDKSILAVEVAKECGNLALATEQFLPMQFAIGFHEFSTYTSLFSKQIMAFHEAGIIAAWKRRWWSQSDCSVGKTSAANSILLYELRGAYYILGAALGLALISLISEIILHKASVPCSHQTSDVVQEEKVNRRTRCSGFIARCKYYVNRLKCCVK